MRAIEAHQTLRPDTVERGQQGISFDPQVPETAERVKAVVGMQSGKHDVAGQRGLNRNFGGLGIANLTDHHDVGVVPQDRAQAARKGETLFLVDRNLQNAGHLVFDRVFNRDDFVAALVQLGEQAIECGGLTGASGAGDQQHPVRLGGKAAQSLE